MSRIGQAFFLPLSLGGRVHFTQFSFGYCLVLCNLSRAHLSPFYAKQCFRQSIPRRCLPEHFCTKFSAGNLGSFWVLVWKVHQGGLSTLCTWVHFASQYESPGQQFFSDGMGSSNNCAFSDPISIRIFAVMVCSTAMVNVSLSCPIQFSDHFTIHSRFLWLLPTLFIQAYHSKLSFLSQFLTITVFSFHSGFYSYRAATPWCSRGTLYRPLPAKPIFLCVKFACVWTLCLNFAVFRHGCQPKWCSVLVKIYFEFGVNFSILT